jgi:nucleoside-diphosphate-sugar epimerase
MISILGCGWYGLELGRALVQDGEKVKGSTTTEARFETIEAAGVTPYLVEISGSELIANHNFFNCNTLIVSIPPRIRSGETDYLAKIQQLISSIIKQGIKQVIYISSTGVYPDCNADLNELNTPQPQSQSGKMLSDAEKLFKNQSAFKTTIIRFGGLVGPGRHPGRFFSGKTNIPNGQAPVNLIHLNDCVALTKSILNNNAFGHTFNACSPHHPTKAEFYTQAALHADLPTPSFIDELLEWKTISSVNIPTVLGYKFAISNWDDCFANNCY